MRRQVEAYTYLEKLVGKQSVLVVLVVRCKNIIINVSFMATRYNSQINKEYVFSNHYVHTKHFYVIIR